MTGSSKRTLAELMTALDAASDSDTASEHEKNLKRVQREFRGLIAHSENARELFLRDMSQVLEESLNWSELYKLAQQRLKIVRPAMRSNHAFVFLVADYLRAARHSERPRPYLCELLDDVRFVEDIAVEPAAIVALREMVQLPDYKLCGKAIYIFKKVSRRFGLPELPFTRPSVEQLFALYLKKYVRMQEQN
jgi:hypothetical protein